MFFLFPERIPKWEMQKLPICDLWCHECATQRCCTRGPHQHHLCMECERRGVVFLAPAGGEIHGLPVRADLSLEAFFFFCCIAELAIKPCRSSRSKLRGEFGIPNTCKTGNKNTTKQQTPPNPKHNTNKKPASVWNVKREVRRG